MDADVGDAVADCGESDFVVATASAAAAVVVASAGFAAETFVVAHLQD